jgi:hypothetical protein
MSKTSKSEAEELFRSALIEFDEFDEEQPMSQVARTLFRCHIVPQLKRMFEERLDRGDHDLAATVFRYRARKGINS